MKKYLTIVLLIIAGCHNNNIEPPQPIVIWFHNTIIHPPDVLDMALSSGLINHAWLLYLNPTDKPLPLPRAVEAIDVCHRHNVKAIWARTLWPSYNVEGFKREDMTDPNYYKTFIEQIRLEATLLGADLTGVDTEPYTFFPFLEIKGTPLAENEFEAVQNAVDLAVAETGQLDFVAPSCGWFPLHIYNALVPLGRLTIGEHTGWDVPFDKSLPYDIFCARVNVTKDNPGNPAGVYFTPQEILFDRKELWQDKAGLFISANHKDMRKVAELLKEFANE
jgi:hypothetical protein